MFVIRAKYASVVGVMCGLYLACANDRTALPARFCEAVECDVACAWPLCSDATSDVAVAFEDADVDGFEVASPESDTGVEDIEPLLDGGATDDDGSIERDVSNPDELDSIEVREGSAGVPFLFTPCETNAECPLPGTVCMKEFQWSHQPTGSERTSIVADELFGPRLRSGLGVCTTSCVSPLDDCRFTDVAGSLVVWDCQLVAVAEPIHPGVDADWIPEYPLVEALDQGAMQRGQPFAAICRPRDSEFGGSEVCKACTRDADCDSGFCWDPVELSGVARADGVVQGYCVDTCVDSPECPLGFTCQSVDSGAFCLPLEGTCGACLDLDGDAYGVGRCTGTGGVSAVDCNDRDALSYYRGADGFPDPSRCSADADSNCNGVNDDAELVGPGLWGSLHCRGCGDICDDTVVDDVSLVNGAIVCRESSSGESECRADCASGFADCNGVVTDGCETPMGTDVDCSSCNDSCVSVVSGAPVGACSGTLDGISTCVIAECPPGTADCNGVFADGCETDTVSTLQSCGGCESDCTDRFAQAIEGCVDSRCTIASCATGFADCDLMPETGCEIDTRNDETHCGSCGRVCNLPNAISECLLSTCTIADCRAGYEDCDGVAANGCEANLNSSVVHCGGCNLTCSIPGATPVCSSGDCAISRCTPGLLDCSPTSWGCETDGTVVGDCGACGEACESVPLGLRACFPNATGTGWSCQCDDSRFTRQECDGEYNRCDETIDEGCPASLGRVGAVYNSSWGVTFTGSPSPALFADQQLPGSGGLVIYRYLHGMEVDWDESGIIQIRPLWLDPIPLAGTGTGRDYPYYRAIRALDELDIRSAGALGVLDASINTSALRVAGIEFTLDYVLSCPRASGAPAHAFALPVAVRLYSGFEDTLFSGIGLLCQTFEIRFRAAIGTDPTDWYEVAPYGAAREVGPVGPGRRFRQQVPEYISGETGTPIVGLQADTNYVSWPQYMDGTIRSDVTVFRALRVVYARPWGLL